MKILISDTIPIAIALVVSSIYGIEKGLSVLCLYFGFREIVNAKGYYYNQQKKMAALSLAVGSFVCICAFFALTNII